MSEEILIALMQFYAIITRQGEEDSDDIKRRYVEKFLKTHLSSNDVQNYMDLFYNFSKQKSAAHVREQRKVGASVLDSVKVLSICKKINGTLNREQKVIVLIRLVEYIKGIDFVNESTIDIINTAADVFQISEQDFQTIKLFLFEENLNLISSTSFCILSSHILSENESFKRIPLKDLSGDIRLIRVASLDLFFLLYKGEDEVYLNGLPVNKNEVYLFARGGILKLPKDGNIYYADILHAFVDEFQRKKLLFEAKNVTFQFNSKQIAIHGVNLTEHEGSLIALMGASGAGKSTLLNIFSGLTSPSTGSIKINDIDIYKQRNKIKGIIGYIPQDDLLMEDLTVFENLYYNAKLCFANLKEDEIKARVEKTLEDLGLYATRNTKVGSPLNKKISGGQRKRLNIALELIREPEVLFVDEPTSGLSSRDSENVMDLLKELTLKGKIVFVVIHQPSSDIFKIFDTLFLLDEGGYPVYYGNPVEAVIYFKKQTNQLNGDIGECVTCGNVNPEIIFNLLEAKVVNDKGEFLDKRIVTPKRWNEIYQENESKWIKTRKELDKLPVPKSNLNIPGKAEQIKIFLTRDIKSKWANLQYVIINILEAPVLAFILASLVKYTDPKESEYIFALNKNIPAFLFMSIIVALFMALTLSAEEIIRDKKILRREALLDLSWSSYLFSKLGILFSITLFQTGIFLFIGKSILAYHDLFFHQWAILFSVGCGGILLGLLISSIFNSAVTIYILIPIMLIPQMILSGAIFKFDELNRFFGSETKVPVVADAMIARWGYEALLVDAFTHNQFNKNFFEIEQRMNEKNYLQVYYIPKILQLTENDIEDDDVNLTWLDQEIKHGQYLNEQLSMFKKTGNKSKLLFELDSISEQLKLDLNTEDTKKSSIIDSMVTALNGTDVYKAYKKQYHNQYVEDLVTNNIGLDYIIVAHHQIIRKKDLIYEIPKMVRFDYRTHFFAPKKILFGRYCDTFYFNILYIWFINLCFFGFIRFKIINRMFKIRD